jgi:hypothetical protein
MRYVTQTLLGCLAAGAAVLTAMDIAYYLKRRPRANIGLVCSHDFGGVVGGRTQRKYLRTSTNETIELDYLYSVPEEASSFRIFNYHDNTTNLVGEETLPEDPSKSATGGISLNTAQLPLGMNKFQMRIYDSSGEEITSSDLVSLRNGDWL